MQYLVTYWPNKHGSGKVWGIEELKTNHETGVVTKMGLGYYVYIEHVFSPHSDLAFALAKAEQLITKFIAEGK